MLGAGLDTFAYRNPHPDLVVWEVDHPDTGAWKKDRLAAAGIDPGAVRYVGVDFERDDLVQRLRESGLDVTRPTFFLWLGVVPYLTQAAVEATLRAIAGIAAPRSCSTTRPGSPVSTRSRCGAGSDWRSGPLRSASRCSARSSPPRWPTCWRAPGSTRSRTSGARRS